MDPVTAEDLHSALQGPPLHICNNLCKQGGMNCLPAVGIYNLKTNGSAKYISRSDYHGYKDCLSNR